MPIKHYLQLESDTVTEKPVKIAFDFNVRDSIPNGKDPGDVIVIKPITVRTWFKLKPMIMAIEAADLDKLIEKEDRTPDAEIMDLIAKYDALLFDIICMGIHNKKSDPPEWFRETLKDNCTWEDVYVLLNAILFRLGYNPFTNSITTLLSVSPMTEAEIIAAQKNLGSYTTDLSAQ